MDFISMNIKIEIKQNKEYFKEFYNETFSYRMKYRKWQPLVAVINLVVAGFFFWKTYPSNLVIVSLLFLLFAIHEAYDYKSSRGKWMKSRLNSKVMGTTSNLIFTDEMIYHQGPYQKGEIKWEMFEKVEETPRGLFLCPQKGVSIYIPKASFENEASYDLILKKFKSISGLKVLQH